MKKIASKRKTHPRSLFFAGLAVLFLFRLGYGLCSKFWTVEEMQVYLIGLKSYATGQWPYYGATAFHSRIPGALQGLSIGFPFQIWAAPEAPFVLLNLLSFSGLCLMAWYCCKLLPNFPRWFIWTWLLTAPWTLNYSTHIVNPSYVLFGSTLFFVGFWEAHPSLGIKALPQSFANALMGFAFFWIIQFHLSGAVLAVPIAASLYLQFKKSASSFLRSLPGFLAGCALSGAFLLPTYLKFGFVGGSGGTGSLFQLNFDNLSSFFSILLKFLSFASFEVPRFLGAHTVERTGFLNGHPWLWPLALFLLLAGWGQTLLMLVQGFRKKKGSPGWKTTRSLALGAFLLVYFCFWFTSKSPSAHTFYLFFPIASIYSFYCLEEWLTLEKWRTLGKVFLACGILYQVGLAWCQAPALSLYKNRALASEAITQKNHLLLGRLESDSW